jgi:hypothetical protein
MTADAPKHLAIWAALAGALVGVICVFFLPAAQIVLGLCAVALVVSVLFFWNSVRTLGGDTDIPDAPPNQAEHPGGALEAKTLRKRMLLLSLKDLENERKLGKISDDDYEDVAQRYRDEVKTLMKEMDAAAAPFRGKAEELLRAHLASKGLGEKGERAAEADTLEDARNAKTIVDPPREESSDDVEKTAEKIDEPEVPTTKKSRDHDSANAPSARAVCSKCGESNEADAKFCKGCAAPMNAHKEAKSEPKTEKTEKSESEGSADA